MDGMADCSKLSDDCSKVSRHCSNRRLIVVNLVKGIELARDCSKLSDNCRKVFGHCSNRRLDCRKSGQRDRDGERL